MKSIQSHPAFTGQNVFGASFKALDMDKQIQVLVDALGRQHSSRPKLVSQKTMSDRFLITHLVFRQLKEEGYALKSILPFSTKHVDVLFKRWQSEGLAPATFQTRVSHLRWLASAIGKAGMVMHPSHHGVGEECTARVYIAESDKSWSAKDAVPADLIAKVREIDTLVACQLRVMHAFGLRAREAIMIKPAISHVGETLRVEEGTKGGRSRVVQIRFQEQLAAIEEAKVVAQSCRKGSLCPAGTTVAQATRRFYYVLSQAGITKAQLGITSHGLRHEYANDLYFVLTGQETLVRGGDQTMGPELDRNARQAVTNDLGHVRLRVTGAYTGSILPRRELLRRQQAAAQASRPGESP